MKIEYKLKKDARLQGRAPGLLKRKGARGDGWLRGRDRGIRDQKVRTGTRQRGRGGTRDMGVRGLG